MFVTKPPFPANIEKCITFPKHEDTYFEFKRNLQTFESLSKAICGMLNRKGGYIVFGIDDETHRIYGIANKPKLIDEFALYIDRITGQKIILTEENHMIHPDSIAIELVPHPIGLLVVLNISPIEGVKYKMIDGSVYIRLNSSTWNVRKEEPLYRKHDVDQIISSRISELTQYKRRAEDKINKLYSKYEALDDERSLLQQYLFRKILQEKEMAEKQFASAHYSFFCCFL